MNVKVNIDDKKVLSKVTGDKFGLFVSHEWKRLIDPYTPRDTGVLMGITGQTVDVKPMELHYKAPYATKVYYGENMRFRKKNPYSTYKWDEAAAKAGQLNKLYRTINAALRSGKI